MCVIFGLSLNYFNFTDEPRLTEKDSFQVQSMVRFVCCDMEFVCYLQCI